MIRRENSSIDHVTYERSTVNHSLFRLIIIIHFCFLSFPGWAQPLQSEDKLELSGKHEKGHSSQVHPSCPSKLGSLNALDTISLDIRNAKSNDIVVGKESRASFELWLRNSTKAAIDYTLRFTPTGMPKDSQIEELNVRSEGGKPVGGLLKEPSPATQPLEVSAKNVTLRPNTCHFYKVSIDLKIPKSTETAELGMCQDKTIGLGFILDLDATNYERSLVGCIAYPSKTNYVRISDDQVSVGALYIEKAIIQKTLADELFLTNNMVGAEKKYGEAKETAKRASQIQDLAPNTRSTQRMLLADIEYRTLLISAGIDFWGGYRGKTPGIPIRHLIALEDLLNEFDRVVSQIELLSAIDSTADKEMLKAKASLSELNGKLGAYLADKERAVVLEKREKRTIDLGSRKLSSIGSAQTAIAARMDSLAEQQDNLQKQADALITRSVISASGVDPLVVDAVKNGDFKQLATSYISSQLADSNSEIAQAVQGISQDSSKFLQLYQQANQKLVDIDELRSDIESAVETIRNPTALNIRKLGMAVLEQLPPEQRSKIEGQLRNSLPAIEWVRAGQQIFSKYSIDEAELKSSIALALKTSGISEESVRQGITPALQTLVQLEGDGIKALNNTFQQIQEKLILEAMNAVDIKDGIHSLAKAVPNRFVHSLPSNILSLLRSHYGLTSDEQLAEAIGRGFDKELSIIGVQADRFVIKSSKLARQVEVLRNDIVLSQPLSTTINAALVDTTRLLDTLLESKTNRVDLVLSQFPTSTLASQLSIVKNDVVIQRLSETVVNALPHAEAKNEMLSGAVSGVIGNAFIEDAIFAASFSTSRENTMAALPFPADVGTKGNDAGINPETNMAITAALNAAFPGAGVAFQLAQNFAASSANAALMAKLADESARLMAEEVELLDRLNEKYFDLVLAQKEQERAEAFLEASKQQVSLYQELMEKALEEANTVDAKVGLRRGWAFYLAERMREEFDLFDRSFALWSRGAATRGVIEEEIKNDPQNVRYALDSDIHLYDWLFRSRESTRTDPDLLRVHWSRMLRLAKDICQRRGCKPGDGLLGQVGGTRSISFVTELLPEDELRRFRVWQQKPDGRFQTEVFLSPLLNILPLGLENIRIVDIKLSAKDAGGSEYLSGPLTLRHDGVSYIPHFTSEKGRPLSLSYLVETFIPRSISSFNTISEFDLNELRVRYDNFFTGTNVPSPRTLEGYGMYAKYSLTIEPVRENLEADDFLIRFAYFYQPSASISSERQFVSALSDGGLYASTASLGLEHDTTNCTDPDVPQQKIKLSNLSRPVLAFFSGRRPSKIVSALQSESNEHAAELVRIRSCTDVKVINTCAAEANAVRNIAQISGRRAKSGGNEKNKLGDILLIKASDREELAKNAMAAYTNCISMQR